MNSNTLAKITEIIDRNIAENKADLKRHEEIKEILQEHFAGKQITKRLETVYAKKFPGRTGAIQRIAGLVNFRIWGGDTGVDFGNGFSHFLGYSGDLGTNDMAAYDPEVFDERDMAYCQGARDRISQLEGVREDKNRLAEYAGAVGAFVKAQEDLNSNPLHDSYRNPAFYDIVRGFGLVKD